MSDSPRRDRPCVSVRVASIGWIAFALLASAARAQPVDGGPVADVRVGGLISIQPAGYGNPGGPYLTAGLGGAVPGFGLAMDYSGPLYMLTVEFSTTTNIDTLQSGRFVGAARVPATHRDTLLSMMPGFQFGNRDTIVEAKTGVSLVFGSTHRGPADSVRLDPDGSVAWTSGVDVVIGARNRVTVVPAFRYSHVVRPPAAIYYGLGADVFRIGVAVRVRLSEPGGSGPPSRTD